MPSSASSPPSQHSPKKRRMTISGSSQASHPVDQASSNPPASDNKTASPPNVVGVSPMDRDDPSPVDQVRSALTTKRNQEVLVEKRRESLGGPLPSSSQSAVSPAVVKPPSASSRTSLRSPNERSTQCPCGRCSLRFQPRCVPGPGSTSALWLVPYVANTFPHILVG